MRTGRPKAPRVLTAEERATLTVLGNRSRTRPRLALRAPEDVKPDETVGIGNL